MGESSTHWGEPQFQNFGQPRECRNSPDALRHNTSEPVDNPYASYPQQRNVKSVEVHPCHTNVDGRTLHRDPTGTPPAVRDAAAARTATGQQRYGRCRQDVREQLHAHNKPDTSPSQVPSTNTAPAPRGRPNRTVSQQPVFLGLPPNPHRAFQQSGLDEPVAFARDAAAFGLDDDLPVGTPAPAVTVAGWTNHPPCVVAVTTSSHEYHPQSPKPARARYQPENPDTHNHPP